VSFGTFGRAAIVAAFFLTAIPAQAAPSAVGVAVSPARLEFKVPAGTTSLSSSFQVANKGSDAVTVQVSLADVVIDKSGAWQTLAAGSTPYSFPATFTPSTLSLSVGKTATVKVTAHVGSRPLMGGVLVHPVATASTAPGTTGLQINPDILIPLLAAPVNGSGVVQGVELKGRAAGLSLPRFQESGPVSVTSAVVNTSTFYERDFTTVTYANLGHTYLTVSLPPQGTFPGGTARSTATSIVTAPGADPFDVTPWFGVIQVTTVTHLTLLDSTAPPIVQSAWIVVAPWRLLLGLLGLLVAGALVWRLRCQRRQEA
jgi:hypothetical protein